MYNVTMLWIKKNILYITWATALMASLGSVYFSQVLHLPPCLLCWYQRIFMFPLVIILAVGILRNDTKVYTYVLPLTIIGLSISLYHNLLYYHVIPENLAPCVAGVSCTIKQIEWLGFITIPLLSLTAFTIITILILIQRGIKKDD